MWKDAAGRGSALPGPDEINNAFFAWQITHELEQQSQEGHERWPELYRDSEDFAQLKSVAKMACLEHLRLVYDMELHMDFMLQLELSMWVSVSVPADDNDSDSIPSLAFHDHPLALLSGVFYAQAGGSRATDRTPISFADPRGTAPFRYVKAPERMRRGGRRSRRKDGLDDQTLDEAEARMKKGVPEPTAPFHRLAYAWASEGLMLVFPPWLVHGVPPHRGSEARVAFAFNLHTLPGTTLSSWAKATL